MRITHGILISFQISILYSYFIYVKGMFPTLTKQNSLGMMIPFHFLRLKASDIILD